MRRQLTAKTLESFSPKARRQEVWDTHLPGFGVRISPNGKKVFFAMRRVGNRQQRVTLGDYPALSLQQARDAARQAFCEAEGRHAGPVMAAPAPLTVRQAVQNFIELHAKPKNKDWRGQQRRLEANLVAAFGDWDIRSISRADMIGLLDKIMARGAPGQANRVLATVRKLFNWCVERCYMDTNPVHKLSAPAKERPRDRVLNNEELAQVWQASDTLGYPFGPLIKLLILTAQRRGEVAGMRWSELDLNARTWALPGSRTKNGRAHLVPLSEPAVDLLKSLPRFLKSDYVFTTTGRTPVSGFGKKKDNLDQSAHVQPWRLHDLRRTAASGMARLGVAPHVVEKILNHSSGIISGVAAVYNRYGYEDEKRTALSAWASFIEEAQHGKRLYIT